MSREDFTTPDGRWRCIKCGACCQHVNLFYPDLDRGDGACKNLGRNNECLIYENRPPLCRVTAFIKRDFNDDLITACNTLKVIYDKERPGN